MLMKSSDISLNIRCAYHATHRYFCVGEECMAWVWVLLDRGKPKDQRRGYLGGRK